MKHKHVVSILCLGAAMLLSACVQNKSSSSSTTENTESASQSASETNTSVSTSASTSSNSTASSTSSTSLSPDIVAKYPYIEKNTTDTIDAHGADSTMIKALDAQMDADARDATQSFTYGGMFSVWAFTDADKSISGNLRSFYSGKSTSPSACNREHVWPNSRKGEVTEDDPHVLRPTLNSENSDRGNSFYGETTGWDPATFKNPKYRGIAARIIFYSAVRYQDSGLWLEDANNPTSTNSDQRPTMGKLSLLLKWNLQYPVDETETQRNDVLYTKYKFCRNVFIDHPEYATKIWGNVNSACKAACGL